MMDVYLCVIKHSDVLLICKTGTKCTSYVKHLCVKKKLDLVELLSTLKAKFDLLFSLSCIGSLR